MKQLLQVDGHHVELVANIGTPNDVKGVIENGGEGVGLIPYRILIHGPRQASNRRRAV